MVFAYLAATAALFSSLEVDTQAVAAPQAPPAKRAKALNSRPIFTEVDYPASAKKNREEGVVGFRIKIGPAGRITDCTVLRSSGSAALDETTCRLLTERARFRPAKDDEGKVTWDSIEREMTWQLP